jgi:hypothetical protein
MSESAILWDIVAAAVMRIAKGRIRVILSTS